MLKHTHTPPDSVCDPRQPFGLPACPGVSCVCSANQLTLTSLFDLFSPHIQVHAHAFHRHTHTHTHTLSMPSSYTHTQHTHMHTKIHTHTLSLPLTHTHTSHTHIQKKQHTHTHSTQSVSDVRLHAPSSRPPMAICFSH